MNIIQYHYPFIIFIDIPSKSFFSFHGLKAVWIDPKTLPVAICRHFGSGERGTCAGCERLSFTESDGFRSEER